MTCFFDASHGPAGQEIMWTPQWGVPRPIRTCPACAQRWAEHVHAQSGYPQQGYAQAGYPQPGYPAQPGYIQDYPQQRHGYGTGAVVAAGAAGFVGGMIANEIFDNDHVDVVEHIDVVEHVDVVEVVEDYGDYNNDW